jgi:hypothetical protein
MTEENKIEPDACPEWCTDDHPPLPEHGCRIHDSRAICPGINEKSTLVMYASQVEWQGKREPALVKVSVAAPDGEHRPRLELPPDQAMALGVIIEDAGRSGIKNIRAMANGLRELSAAVTEPEADEPEAGA